MSASAPNQVWTWDITKLAIYERGVFLNLYVVLDLFSRYVVEKGSADHLVQRAIRGTGHCEFTTAEQVTAFEALAKWEQEGTKPEGDDVLDAAKVADPNYGCKFTQNTYTPEEMAAGTLPMVRATAPACP